LDTITGAQPQQQKDTQASKKKQQHGAHESPALYGTAGVWPCAS